MATIQFDDDLDAQLEQVVPPTYRGGKKVAIRADYVAREWLRDRQDKSNDRDRDVQQPAA